MPPAGVNKVKGGGGRGRKGEEGGRIKKWGKTFEHLSSTGKISKPKYSSVLTL